MLENINSPQDLKKLNNVQLEALSDEVRKVIIETVSKNGGHLASNLGIVEPTIVLHRLFNLPDDKIIFDVGHQCYTHKLLTGRYRDFSTLRQKDGISGFTNRDESTYDMFTAGHSGSSVSTALGMATAESMNGTGNYVVAVVGDGSFTNGMIYEALNNCNKKNLKLIILLNDNEMSISSNVGSLAEYLSKIRTSTKYFNLKRRFQNRLRKVPYLGEQIIVFSRKCKNVLKRLVLSKDRFFNTLGVKYLGPVDGNDIHRLEAVLAEAKRCGECCLVHVKTKKGKGYSPAEKHPEHYHSVGKFDAEVGISPVSKPCFSTEFGRIMCFAASKDENVCAITAAMCEGTGLLEYSKYFSDRFFDVGIAEEHEIAFAAGLAAEGKKPVCAVYSTFAQRTFDQVFHDVSIQKLHVVLALDRAGFVPDDGITHQGLFDVSLFSSLPDCTIYSPETYSEMWESFSKAFGEKSVSIVRFAKGTQTEYDRDGFSSFDNNNAFVRFVDNPDVVIFTYGRACVNAVKAANLLKDKVRIKVVKLVKICPLDEEKIIELAQNSPLVYVLEEGMKGGGVGEKIASALSGKTKVVINAVDGRYAPHASVEQLYEMFGMSPKQVAEQIENLAKTKN